MMIVSCPICSKRYLVDALLIAPQGRSVRCVACGHVWTQQKPLETSISHHIDDQTVKPIKPSNGLTKYLFILMLSMVALTAGYYTRHQIAEYAPRIGAVMEKLGIVQKNMSQGLILDNIVPLKNQENDRTYLVIKGEIVNTTKEVKQTLPLTIQIPGKCTKLSPLQKMMVKIFKQPLPKNCIIDKWQHTPTQSRLLPGERLSFETVPHLMNYVASEVSVDF